MEDAILFTRQWGESSKGTVQETLDAQIREIEALAEREQLRIVDKVVMTGTGAAELFEKLIAYLRTDPAVKTIVTYSMDRLFRSIEKRETLLRMIEEGQLKAIIACSGGVLTATNSLPGHPAANKNAEDLMLPPFGYRIDSTHVVIDSVSGPSVYAAFDQKRLRSILESQKYAGVIDSKGRVFNGAPAPTFRTRMFTRVQKILRRYWK